MIRLLWVDDAQDELELACLAATEFAPDMSVSRCQTQAQAVAAATAVTHDLALIDLHLGGTSGLDLIGKLICRIGAVVLSTVHDQKAADSSHVAGARAFWVKPARYGDYDALFAAIRRLMAAQPAPAMP